MTNNYNIKTIRQLYNLTQEEFALALGITRELVNKMEKGKSKVSKATDLLIQRFIQERKSENYSYDFVSDVELLSRPKKEHYAATPYYLQRQQQKNEKNGYLVPLIGVKAQAGYVKGYEQVDNYVETLEKFSLPPGVKPEGANWSYFEVDGDSMEPTLSSGDIILVSMVHHEDWQEIRNFHIYVILTSDSVVVKRVYKKSTDEWVLISDNEEAYPPKAIAVNEIKEIWTFRRHIRAKAPAPRAFENDF